MSAPRTFETPLAIACNEAGLYALRSDGAVFVLLRRGHILPDSTVVGDPYWALCPPIPGTVAALEAEG